MNDSWKFGLRQHWFKRKYVFSLLTVQIVTAFFRFQVLNIFAHSLSAFFFFILSKIMWEPLSVTPILYFCVFVFYLKTPSVIKLWHWMIGWLANTKLPRILHEVFGTNWGIIPAFVETQKPRKPSVRIACFPAMIRTSPSMFRLEALPLEPCRCYQIYVF